MLSCKALEQYVCTAGLISTTCRSPLVFRVSQKALLRSTTLHFGFRTAPIFYPHYPDTYTRNVYKVLLRSKRLYRWNAKERKNIMRLHTTICTMFLCKTTAKFTYSHRCCLTMMMWQCHPSKVKCEKWNIKVNNLNSIWFKFGWKEAVWLGKNKSMRVTEDKFGTEHLVAFIARYANLYYSRISTIITRQKYNKIPFECHRIHEPHRAHCQLATMTVWIDTFISKTTNVFPVDLHRSGPS